MSLIERYLLRQILGPCLLAGLALAAVGLLSQSLGALDLIVTQGQSAWVLMKISLLAMPQLLVLIAPIALFIGTLVALNRLHTEQEIVVCFASGVTVWRVIAPAIKLATIAALGCLAFNLWVEPWSERTMREELFRVRTDLAASLVHVGQFNEPSPNLTVYAQDNDQNGVFHNMFIYNRQPDGGDVTFLASQGRITKRKGAPVLVMHEGSEQQFSSSGVLNYLKFSEYIFDLTPFMSGEELIRYKPSDRYLHELLAPDPLDVSKRKDRLKLAAEANSRLASPLYCFAFMAIALAAVIGGPFSRLGYGRRIVVAGVAVALARIAGFGIEAVCGANAGLNVLQYVIPLAPAVAAMTTLLSPGFPWRGLRGSKAAASRGARFEGAL